MPRLVHQPPKYSLHKPSRQAVVYFEGKAYYLGPHGSAESHRRYQAFLDHWRSIRHQEAASEDTPEKRVAAAVTPQRLREKRRKGLSVSIDELIYVYRQHARGYYVKNGKVTREAQLIEEITKLLGEKHGRDKVEEFGPLDLDAFREALIDERDWSRLFINKQMVRLVAMFKWGVQKELCAAEVHRQLAALGGLKKGRTRARESEGVDCIADDVVETTLPSLPPIVADMVRLQRLCGARPGEVCALRPCDLDRDGEVWLYRPDSHKTEHHDKGRVIAIGPQAQRLLIPYLDRHEDAYCFSPMESERQRHGKRTRRTPLTSGNRAGARRLPVTKWRPRDHYDVASYRHAIRRACKRLGLAIWSPNQLRHTAATEIRKRYGLEAAQVVCGHSRADVTQVYAERDLRLAMKVAAEVG